MAEEERFCDRLNAQIEKQRPKLRQLASDAKISINTLGNLRANTVQPRETTIKGLAKALGVSADWLRTGVETTEAQPVDDMPSLKGFFNGKVFQTVEAVIEAEVKRRMTEQLEKLLEEALEEDVAILRRYIGRVLTEHAAEPSPAGNAGRQ